MNRRFRSAVCVLVFGGAMLTAGMVIQGRTDAADKKPETIVSKIVGWEEARAHQADWGEMRFYFTGETSGSKSVLTAVASSSRVRPSIKAHRHAEEEYLAVVEGSGTWSLDGKRARPSVATCSTPLLGVPRSDQHRRQTADLPGGPLHEQRRTRPAPPRQPARRGEVDRRPARLRSDKPQQ